MRIHNIEGHVAIHLLEKIIGNSSQGDDNKVVAGKPTIAIKQDNGKMNTALVHAVTLRIEGGEIRGDIDCTLTDMASIATIKIMSL